MHTVHAHAAEHLEIGYCLTDKISAVVTTEVVRFEHYSTITRPPGITDKRKFVRDPNFAVGGTMQMNVAHTVQHSVRCISRLFFWAFS